MFTIIEVTNIYKKKMFSAKIMVNGIYDNYIEANEKHLYFSEEYPNRHFHIMELGKTELYFDVPIK